MESTQRRTNEAHIEAVGDLLKGGQLQPVKRMLNALTPREISHLLESLPREERRLVWGLVDPEISGEVLVDLADDVRKSLLDGIQAHEIAAHAEGLDTDDLADLIQELPEQITSQILQLMDHQDRKRVETVLAYDKDTAGGLMNTDTVTVRGDVTIDVVLRYLRLRGELPSHTDALIVVNRDDRYLGMLPLTSIVSADIDRTVAELTIPQPSISVSTPAKEVAKTFEKFNLVSSAVVDQKGRLLGRVTVDDVVDLIREEAEHNLLVHAGLNEEDDIFAPVWSSSARRAVWLGVNLLTAFLAAWVIARFQVTLEKVVALAVLMPIVASMGGIAGTQTLTLVIRGLALGRLQKQNTRWLLFKEIAVGLVNGLIWATVVAAITVLWFHNLKIGVIIAAALIINLLMAAFSGVAIPLILKKMSIDPALAGGVILTTVTDVVGFLTFLGLASIVFR